MAFIGKDPVWFITGCSTGFGRELAQSILAQGGRVVVTARDSARVQDLAAPHRDRALALALDVNDARARSAAVQAATDKFGRIDVLVNNAGYGYMAAIEEGEEDAVRAMFETNVFGLVGMTNSVLPGMRQRRAGHVVNLSSMGGLCGFPGVGYYNATKFAVEGLSEALAAELGPLGIGVTIVEPGPFRTDWAGRSLKLTHTDIADYADTAGARRRQISGYSGTQAGDPVRAAEAIIQAVHADTPPLRLLLGSIAYDLVAKKLTSMRQNFEAWEAVSRGADYPQTQAAE
jgi:NAD(P)-dependent dehydrogenase (short-subunit alcohol dehydrogenase family)